MNNNKNMRLGISTLICNMNKALKICEENEVINHVEVGIDNLEDCDELIKYTDNIKHLGLTIGIHLPMEMNPCEDIKFIRDQWISYILYLSQKLKSLNISYYNMHLGYVITNRLNKNKEKYLNNIVSFFHDLYIETKIPITIENTYTKGGDLSNIGTSVEDFQYILNNNKNLRFCYDTGHDIICKSNYNLLKNKIKIIHLSDNNGTEDEHLPIMKGKLKYEDLQQIFKVNYEFLVLEMDLCYALESIDTLKKLS